MVLRARTRLAIQVLLIGGLGGTCWWLLSRTSAKAASGVDEAPLPTFSELAPVDSAAPRPVHVAGHDVLPVPVPGQRVVRIADGEGAPLVGARVGFDQPTNVVCASLMGRADPVLVQYPLSFDPEARLADRAPLLSGSHGGVELPTGATLVRVWARHGHDYGQRIVAFDGRIEVPVIVVAPDRLLRVRVVDANGRPRAGVPVQASFQAGEDARGAVFASVHLEPSDQDGVTVLVHAQALPFWDPAHAELAVRAKILAADTVTVRVPLDRPVPDVIDVPCPPHGSIRIRAVPGLPGVAGDFAWLWPVDEKGNPESWSSPRGYASQTGRVALGKTALVALDKAWRVGTVGNRGGRFAGPRRDGERISVDLVPEALGDGQRLASVRLLAPDGRPYASTSIEVAEVRSGPYFPWRRVATDTDARIRFVVGGLAGLVRLDCPAHRSGREVAVPAHDQATGASIDLGEVRLIAKTRLASGRVVDAAGAAMSACVWAGEGPVESVTATDGSFQLWSAATRQGEGMVSLNATAWGYGTTSRTVPVVASDVVLVLQPWPRATARVLTDTGVPAWALDIYVDQQGRRSPYRRTNGRGSSECVFRVDDPTRLALAVAGAEGQRPLGTVPAGDWQAAADGHEVVVDLRGKLDRVTAVFAGPGSLPAAYDALGIEPFGPSGKIYARAKGSTDTWGEVAIGDRWFLAQHGTLVAPKGATLEAVARMWSGPAVAGDLHAGENVIPLPPVPQAIVDVQGLPSEIERAEVDIEVWLLERREPLLDQVVSPHETEGWPPRGRGRHPEFGAGLRAQGATVVHLGPRGRYMAAARIGRPHRWTPFHDAAIPIEITAPGQTVHATIRLDPEQVRKELAR